MMAKAAATFTFYPTKAPDTRRDFEAGQDIDGLDPADLQLLKDKGLAVEPAFDGKATKKGGA